MAYFYLPTVLLLAMQGLFFNHLAASSVELVFESTTIVHYMDKTTRIHMDADFVRLENKTTSSYKYYAGYVVKINDTVNIQCNATGYHPELELTRYLVDRNITTAMTNDVDRVTKTSRRSDTGHHTQINVTIHRALPSDSGRYKCDDDHRQLRVIVPDNPPRILSHQCISMRFDNLVCTFQTNANKTDLVNWNVTFSTRKSRYCNGKPCKDIPCGGRLRISPDTDGGVHDTILCNVGGHVFNSMIYDFQIIGANPFVTHSDNISTSIDHTIAKLGPPQIISTIKTSHSVSVQIRIYKDDMPRAGHQYYGFVGDAILRHGVKYHVTVDSATLRASKYRYTVPIVLTFTDEDTTSWLNVSNLLPHTTYIFSIKTQMNSTINPDVWSTAIRRVIKTSEYLPESAPEQSPYGFVIGKSAACGSRRQITLYWKRLSEMPLRGNGFITSYQLHARVQDGGQYDQIDVPPNQKTVVGKSTSAEVCVGDEASEITITAKNAVGGGSKSGRYYIPSLAKLIEIKTCNISVTYIKDTDELEMQWPTHSDERNYTIFWCEVDIEDNCKNKEIEWREASMDRKFVIPRWKQRLPPSVDTSEIRHKFGLSAHGRDQRSASGIVWASCINYLGEALRPVEVDVQLSGMNATVEVKDSCRRDSRMAEYYVVHSCVTSADKTCISKEKSVRVEPCNMLASISLENYRTTYAFWVVSFANGTSVESAIIEKQTEKKGWDWEIAVPAALSSLAIVGITLCCLYLREQRRRVQRFKHPQLVQPTTLMLETDDISLSLDENDSEDQNSFLPYMTTTDSFTPLVAQDNPATSRDYENGFQQENGSGFYAIPKNGLFDPQNYQPSMSQLGDKVDYGNVSSVPSCGRLPDDYLQCTKAEPDDYLQREKPGLGDYLHCTNAGPDDYLHCTKSGPDDYLHCTRAGPDDYLQCPKAEPELSVSAQLFYTGNSHDSRIDINRFLMNSGSACGSTLTKPQLDCSNQLGITPGLALATKLEVDLEEPDKCLQHEEESKLLVDMPPPLADVERCAQTSNGDNNNGVGEYVTRPGVDYIIDPNAEQTAPKYSEGDNVVQTMNTPESTSGDSGYVGRNAEADMCPRSNSLTSSES